MTDEQEDDYKDEDNILLSLLAQQLKVDQSILLNTDLELPTKENTGNGKETWYQALLNW